MRKQSWIKRDPIKNYFPLPNEIYSLGLSSTAIAVYGYLLCREDRKTYQLSGQLPDDCGGHREKRDDGAEVCA